MQRDVWVNGCEPRRELIHLGVGIVDARNHERGHLKVTGRRLGKQLDGVLYAGEVPAQHLIGLCRKGLEVDIRCVNERRDRLHHFFRHASR